MDASEDATAAAPLPVHIKTEPPDVPDGSLEPEIDLQEESRNYNPNEVYVKKNSAVYITHQLAEVLDDDELLPDCGSEELEQIFSVEDTADVFYRLSPLLICQNASDGGTEFSLIARCDTAVPTHFIKRLVKKAAGMVPLSCFLRAVDANDVMVVRIRSIKTEGSQPPVFVVTHLSAPRSSFSDRAAATRKHQPVAEKKALLSPVQDVPRAPASKEGLPSTSRVDKRTARPSSGGSLGVARVPCDPKNPPQLEVAKQTLTNGVPFSPAPLYHIAHRRRCSKIRRKAQSVAAANQDPTKINHTCGECFKKFTSYKVYLVHLHFHVYGRFRCEQCAFACDSRREGVRHMGQHDPNLRPLLCGICGDDSHRNLHDFLVHSLSHDERFPKKTSCRICGVSIHRFLLHKHLLAHRSVRKFSCEHCGHAYTTKAALERHVANVHNRAKRHACDLCGKAYAQKCSLDYHVRTHSENRRPFRCDLCSRAFPAKITLLLHKRKKHSRGRPGVQRRYPVVCMSCGDASANMLELQMHTCRNRVGPAFSGTPVPRSLRAELASPRVLVAPRPLATPVAKGAADETLAQKMLLNLRSAIGSAIAKSGGKS
ncbi:zinc finger protein, putative [Ixodes scapularis]|uniref:Zinc finger protein, putative n=1 Tax=Ixodes scapularis TaxID=6945 RepID=B7PIW0_IXOSC|nr:zinc finger protein, putative [Ixodes scapularis]|eukprot:XP_002406501.1 zinc finger protein, putative [Ixodes scapularis]